jgi:GTP-binding protein HflX
VLVGIDLPAHFSRDHGGQADTEELALLVDTAGAEVIDTLHQRRQAPDTATYVGRGKLAQIKESVIEGGANLVVFDNELSPAQGRNLEHELEVNVLDRTELILDIFARHARTRQARLQVELAQLQYLLPRLTRLWHHLERQAGGIGTRGPGETQLETDRRLIRRRIGQLKKSLAEIGTRQDVQRRRRHDLFRAALVGYTNAGKSTLMNAITDAGVTVRDQLFATLDATTRRVETDERHRFLLTDTVGFIRKLPHHLVESFRATLQEVADADMLIHVVDASSPDPEQQIESVNAVLAEIVPQEKPALLVFNKMDLVAAEQTVNCYSRLHPGALFVSSLSPPGPLAVRDAIVAHLMALERIYELELPTSSLSCLAPLYRTGSVLEQTAENGMCRAVVRMYEPEARRLLAARPEVHLVSGS